MLKQIFALFLLFIGTYLSAHFYMRWKYTVKNDITKVSRLLNCEATRIRVLALSRNLQAAKPESFEFERRDKTPQGVPDSVQMDFADWFFRQPQIGDADSSLLSRIISMSCETYNPMPVRSENFVSEISLRLEEEVHEGSDPKILFLNFSAESLKEGLVQVGPAGAQRTFKILPKLAQLLSMPLIAYQNHQVLSLSADNIQELRVFEKDKIFLRFEREGGDWHLYGSGKDLGIVTEESEKYINRLSTLRAVDLLSNELSKEDCVKKANAFRIEVEGIGARKETLRFSLPQKVDGAKEPRMLACSSTRHALFGVHPDMLKYLRMKFKGK